MACRRPGWQAVKPIILDATAQVLGEN